MSFSITPQASPLVAKVGSDPSVGSSPVTNATGAVGSIFNVEIDNTENPAEKVYFKVYNDLNPTIGTTGPDLVIPVAPGVKRSLVIPEGMEFDVGITYCCVTTPGSAGTTAPGNDVSMNMVVS